MYLKDLSFNYFGTLWSAILGFVFVPVYLACLGFEAYGVIGVFSVLQSVFALIDATVSPLWIGEISKLRVRATTLSSTDEFRRALGGVMLLIATASLVIICIVAPSATVAMIQRGVPDDGDLTLSILMLGGALVARIFEGYFRSGLVGLSLQAQLNVWICVCATIRSAGAAITVTMLSPTLFAFTCWQLIAAVIAASIFGVLFRKAMPRGPRRPFAGFLVLQNRLRFALGVFAGAALEVIYAAWQQSMLIALLPMSQFGAYAAAMSVAGITNSVSLPFINVFYPRICAAIAQGDQARIAHVLRSTSQLISVLVWSMVFSLAMAGRHLLFGWSGRIGIVTELAPLVPGLAFSAGLGAMCIVPYRYKMAMGHTRFWAITNLCTLLAGAAGLGFVVPRFGAVGASIYGAILNLAVLSLAAPLSMRSALPSSIAWLLRDVVCPFFGAAVGASVVALIFDYMPSSRISSLAVFAAALLLSLVGATVCASLIRNQLLEAWRGR